MYGLSKTILDGFSYEVQNVHSHFVAPLCHSVAPIFKESVGFIWIFHIQQ